MTAGKTFFDTNVLVYVVDRDSPAKRSLARELLEREVAAGGPVVSTQVLQEFYVTVTRKLRRPVPEPEALSLTAEMGAYPLIRVDRSIILRAIALSQRDRISFWDALIVQAALTSGCERLLTEDLQDGRRFGDLVVENPFAGIPT